jgi:tetratricopeptide (TPR) repeat protein
LCSSNPDDAELAELAARAHQIAEVINPQVRAIFEKALAGKPRDPALLMNLANSCREAGELNKAIDHYSSVLEIDPNNAEALDALARLFAQTHRRTPQAAAILRRVLVHRPEDPELRLLHAELLIEEGKSPEAFGILRQLLQQHPDRGLEILAVAERGHPASEHELERMILLARLYTLAGRADDALDTLGLLQANHQPGLSELLPAYDALIERYPGHVRARVERAILYKLAGQYEMALSDLDAIAENADQAGSTPNILSELAEVLELHLTRQKDPKPEILLKLGRLQQQLGELKNAARTYKRILERDPRNQEAHLILARSFITQGQLDAAREHLRACAEITPEVLSTQGDLARALERLGRWDQAIQVLQSAGTEEEHPSEHRLLLARLQQRARQETTAKQAKSFLGELPDTIRQRYELLQQISQEGEKIVFRAYDREKNEVLAIKLFPPWISEDEEAREIFRARAEAVRQLLHPNIVALLGAGVGPSRPYAMLEYVTGGDLRTRLRRARGPLSIPELRRLAQALAEAFAFAHSKQIIHGGLRPSRILVTLDGRIKVAAFLSAGLPLAPSALAEENTLPPGTEDYQSPEQLERARATPTAAADIFAYGSVLYHAVTGTAPTVGMTTSEVAKNPGAGQALLRVGPALSALILHCLQGEAANRPPDFGAVLNMLKTA